MNFCTHFFSPSHSIFLRLLQLRLAIQKLCLCPAHLSVCHDSCLWSLDSILWCVCAFLLKNSLESFICLSFMALCSSSSTLLHHDLSKANYLLFSRFLVSLLALACFLSCFFGLFYNLYTIWNGSQIILLFIPIPRCSKCNVCVYLFLFLQLMLTITSIRFANLLPFINDHNAPFM